ncbi:MAG: tetratricopeptide repeat protein [Luteimonas sp.]|nr:tetratricopeptide repeat protein [Luteimonas sp.]
MLPFTSLGPDRSEDYFAEGLAVEMHDALAGVPGLVVAAQMSPALATAREADIKALGQRLGVATVLDASVRREGDRVRINARLSDTGTGHTLWSRSYDREMAGIFAIQSEIADEVVNALLDVLPEERKALADRLSPTKSAVAFDLYLKGIRRLSRQDRDAPGEAIGFFQRALATDGSFARAQAGVCLSEVFRYEHERIADALDKAREACAHAESLSGGSGQASLALAKLHHAQGNLGEAGKFYARAEADPARKAEALVGMALIHGSQGRHAEALRDFGQAIEASPGDDVIHSYIGYYHYLAGDLPAAIAAYRKAIEISPGDAGYWSTLGTLLANAGESDAAADALGRSLAIEPDNHLALNNLGEIRYQSGDYAGATALYRKAASLEPADYIPWGNLGRTLLADAATMDQAKHAFEQAALRARAYVDARPGDATALAALAWFSVNLGQRDEARELVRRSEALGGDPIEAALYNAMTFVALGELDQSRKRIASAREAGLSETRIASNTVLRGLAVAGP